VAGGQRGQTSASQQLSLLNAINGRVQTGQNSCLLAEKFNMIGSISKNQLCLIAWRAG